jgi:hypothetical protein
MPVFERSDAEFVELVGEPTDGTRKRALPRERPDLPCRADKPGQQSSQSFLWLWRPASACWADEPPRVEPPPDPPLEDEPSFL